MALFGDDLVYWSVGEVNRQNAGKGGKPMNMKCPRGCPDSWTTFHGVDPQYRSEWNPGEYVDFICAGCGYTEQHPC